MAIKTTTTSSSLNIGIDNTNGKTRYISVPNPKQDVDVSGVLAAMQNFIKNGILIDEGNGQPITSDTAISTAYTSYNTITTAEF